MISKTNKIFLNAVNELISEAATELKLNPDKPIVSGIKKTLGGISNLALSKQNVFKQIADWMNNPTIDLGIKFASIASSDEPNTGDRIAIKIRDKIIEGKITAKKLQKFKFYYEIRPLNEAEIGNIFLNYSSLSTSKSAKLGIVYKGKTDKMEEYFCHINSQKIKNKKYWVINVIKKYEGEEIEDGFEDVKNKTAAGTLLNYYLNVTDRNELTEEQQDKYVIALLGLAKKISEFASTAAGTNVYVELITNLKNEPDFEGYSIDTKLDNLLKELSSGTMKELVGSVK